MKLDLKKIAEKINRDRVLGVISTRDVDTAALLDALVEERAKTMTLQFYADHPVRIDESNRDPLLHLYCGPCSAGNKPDPRHKWTDRQWRTHAITELGLEGVWPVKEGE